MLKSSDDRFARMIRRRGADCMNNRAAADSYGQNSHEFCYAATFVRPVWQLLLGERVPLPPRNSRNATEGVPYRAVSQLREKSGPQGKTRLLQIAVTNEQSQLEIDAARLRIAVETVMAGEGISDGDISLAVVDDAAIHELNRRWLEHDEPTDVLSFVLEQSAGYREGEIIVSAETALARAAEFGWSAGDELLLYVVHGALHIAGYDDREQADREQMRERERLYLERLGVGQDSERRSRGGHTASPPS
jgi:probable rRNA maturation factor